MQGTVRLPVPTTGKAEAGPLTGRRRNRGNTGQSRETGVEGARRRMGATVLQSAYTSLSSIDQTYLLCMAEDEGPSSTSKIASRMAVGHQYAGVYRRRLIDAGVITPDGHGLVNFAVPRLREYLREQPGYGVHPTTPRNP